MAVYEYDSQNDELNRIAGGTLFADLPIGFILPSFESIAPQGFLKMTDTLANRTVSRTTYKELFDWATERDLIGTGKPFGVGDGSTTFVIPDGKEIAFKGIGEYEGTVGAHIKSGGLAVGEFVDDRLQSHSHYVENNVNDYKYSGFDSNINGGSNYNVPILKASGTITTRAKNIDEGRNGVTTEVKSLGCHYYIKAKNVGVPADFVSAIDDVIGDKLSYSTTEINTGKKWIDGKPIYRKVVNFGALPNNTNKSVDHNITNLDHFVSVSGIAIASNKTSLPLPRAQSIDTQNIDLFATATGVVIYTGVDDSNYTGYVTLEYTKTTD